MSTKDTSAIEHVTDAFEAACRTLAPLAPGARLLLACSAGGDSMTLLDLMARQARARRWQLAIVHLDHRQRPQSSAEAQYVMDQARRYGVAAFVERLGDELVEASPLTEDVMRQARHNCYRRFAAAWGAPAVALAHQADDRAETLLIRLLAGSGPTGLGSIRPVERLGDLILVRPLLTARRRDMRRYLNARGIPWHDDPSNDELDTKRGWVRNALLPLVHERIGLDPTERIARGAELIDAEAATLGEACRLMLAQLQTLPQIPIPGAGEAQALARLDLTHPLWSQASPLLRRQLLRQWLWDLRRGPHPPGYQAVSDALVFVQQAQPGAELRTIERIHVVHCKNALLAFAPEVDQPARQTLATPHLPPPKPKKKKSV